MTVDHVEPAKEASVDGALYREVRQFLFDEAAAIDDKAYDEWLAMMTDEVRYRVPTRVSTAAGGRADFDNDIADHVDDNRFRLEKRVERLRTEHAWAEQPPSRTRHFVSNIRITDYDPDEERVSVRSNLALQVTRGGFTLGDGEDDTIRLTGERRDKLYRTNGEWKLDERTIYLDHEVLPAIKISVFI